MSTQDIRATQRRAAGCRQSVGAAWSSSSLGVPPNAGSLLRLTSGLDGHTLYESHRVCPSRNGGNQSKDPASG
eukprot:1133257-Prymnesium_polylepis.1